MTDWTGREIEATRAELESNAAATLGRFLLEFSRLEMELGLDLAWKSGGLQLEEVTSQLESAAFGVRLDRLKVWVAEVSTKHMAAGRAYTAWLESAEDVRVIRNQFIHGRWAVSPTTGKIANVVGLPTSPKQCEVLYSPVELAAQVEKVIRLRTELSRIREAWPLL